ncbi:MAG: segregation/condensation protein A [Saprospiraceae bacterium]|nr:segregation/condensation protein A [Saprospiraceae bacterium]
MDNYTIRTAHFEGPFDLLLFFIERDELDIHDIPIAKITGDFLDYIRHLETLNIDVASEFILMAATLMKIKSRMLIPRKELDEHGNEIDPRQELAQKLLEYKKYKSVLDEFSQLEDLRQKQFSRGGTLTELRQIAEKALIDSELESLSLYKLMQTFRQLLENFEREKHRAVHRIVKFDYTVEGQQDYIMNLLPKGQKVRFEGIFHSLENRIHAIVTFMALLDLLNLQQVKIIQGEGTNNFWVEKAETAVA